MATLIQRSGNTLTLPGGLGDLTGRIVRLEFDNIDVWGASAQLFSQGGDEFGYLPFGGAIHFQRWGGDQQQNVSDFLDDQRTTKLFGRRFTLEFNGVTRQLTVIIEAYNGAQITRSYAIGTTDRFTNSAAGADFILLEGVAPGARLGNTRVFIDGVLTHDWDMSQASGTVIPDQTGNGDLILSGQNTLNVFSSDDESSYDLSRSLFIAKAGQSNGNDFSPPGTPPDQFGQQVYTWNTFHKRFWPAFHQNLSSPQIGSVNNRLVRLTQIVAQEYPDRPIVVGDVTLGSTGFDGSIGGFPNIWDVGDPLQLETVEMIEEVMQLLPDTQVFCFEWFQGEQQAFGTSTEVHLGYIQDFFNALRLSSFGQNNVIHINNILGPLNNPDGVAEINAAHTQFVALDNNATQVDTSDLSLFDNLHFDRNSQRTIAERTFPQVNAALPPFIDIPVVVNVVDQQPFSIEFFIDNFTGTPESSVGEISDLGNSNFELIIPQGFDFEVGETQTFTITAGNVSKQISVTVQNVFENAIVDAGELVIDVDYAGVVTINQVTEWAQSFTGSTANNLNALSFPLAGGVYSVTFTAFDAAPVTQTITVNEAARPDPVITLVGIEPEEGVHRISIIRGNAFELPALTAVDADENNLANDISIAGVVDSNQLGEYSLVISVVDLEAQAASISLVVSVLPEPLIDLVMQAEVKGAYSSKRVNSVYLGRDNGVYLHFYHNSKALVFDGVTRYVLLDMEGAVIVDTLETPSAIKPAIINSTPALEFDLEPLPLANGAFSATLVAYDAIHTNGQVIVHASSGRLAFNILQS